MRSLRPRFSFAFALALAAAPATALGQSTENSTIAESLFHDAQARLAAGDVGAACDLFARSQRVEAALGTLLNLAACHERDGKTATAWTEFQNAVSWAVRNGDKAREQYARGHVATLDGLLHRVVIEVLAPEEGLQAVLDGAPLPREALGSAIPLDPGEHSIEVSASGKITWVRKINLGPAAGTDRIEVRLEPLGKTPPAPTAPPPGAESTPGPAPAPASAPAPAPAPAPALASDSLSSAPVAGSSSNDMRRVAGFVAGGIGVVGVGAAVILGATMAHYTSDRDALCPPGTPCTSQKAFDEDHAARLDQQWMFVTGGIGVAGLAAGLALILTSHAPARTASSSHVDFAADAHGGAIRLSGAW